ncbi:MAG: 2-succinylbenzoate--CoA ligase [Bacteroidota bacterium]|jgi:O-succinylbenzoic acid--CoA ligase
MTFDRITYIDTNPNGKTEVQNFIQDWYSKDLVIQTKTSGSTGEAKIISLEKSKMIVSAKKTLSFLGLKKGDTALLCLPLNSIAGKMMIVRAIVGELNLVVGLIDSNPLQHVQHKIDFVALVPLQFQNSIENNSTKLKSIKSIIVGGGPISSKLEKQVITSNVKAFQTYGMTETISHVALREIGNKKDSHYHALDGISFSEKNEQLIIHYPEIGIKEMQTTDIVKLISPTNFEWIGRTDFIINVGGIKLNPEEIETILSEYINSPFIISSVSDDKLGEIVILLIEGDEAFTIDDATLQKKLKKFAIPKHIYYLPSFYWTSSGKVNRIETLKLLHSN